MLKIVADNAIPLLEALCSSFAHIKRLPGSQITHQDLTDADALFVRTITPVTSTLLENTPVKFVGSMTAGVNHIDTKWLHDNHIYFANAKGANANAVAEYLIACVAYLQQQCLLPTQNLTAGIIGVGHVGSRVSQLLQAIGAQLIYCDPPRARTDAHFDSTPLADFTELDLVSLHTPLTLTGDYKTQHLIDHAFLQQQKKTCVLINTSRGEVINSTALLNHPKLSCCLDVYEHEPQINLDLLSRAHIATPHIAGYSWQAKLNATLQVCTAARDFFHYSTLTHASAIMANALPSPTAPLTGHSWQEVVLQAYHPRVDSDAFKTLLQENKSSIAETFEKQRRHYPLRLEFSAFSVETTHLSDADKEILHRLGWQLNQ